MPRKTFRSADREYVAVNGLLLPDYLLALDSQLTETTIVKAYTQSGRFNVLMGGALAKPRLVFTDGEVSEVSPDNRFFYSQEPTYIAWIAQEMQPGYASPYFLRTALKAPKLRKLQKDLATQHIVFRCEPIRGSRG